MYLENILNNDRKKIGTYDSSYSTKITFQELADICVNKKKYKLNDPPFQTPLDLDRVQEMYESHIKHPHFLLSKAIITIAIVNVGSEKEYYLMDGQHRMNAIKIIYEKTNENNNMIIVVHNVKNENEMRDLFNELNKDSSKNLAYVSLPIFGKIIIEKIIKKLSKKYEGCYSENKNAKSSLFSVNEFVTFLQDADYFNANSANSDNSDTDANVNRIIDEIDKKHKIFFNTLKYLENSDNEKKYSKREIDVITHYRNVIFFKNNNFIEYLINNDIPTHDDIEKRRNITDTTRSKVWKNEFKKNTTGKCPVLYCESKLSSTTKHGFQCGHIISVANKGKTIESNLRPICANCNSKMSSQNWDSYEEELRREHEWENKFGNDNDEANCENCEKKIKKDTFYMVLSKKKKNKYKMLCRKCSKEYQ